MNLAGYLKYFFFIGNNWNYRLAIFSIYYEIRGEKKYQINTSSIDYLRNEKIESDNLKHASIYQGTSYYLLEKAFDYLKEENAIGNIADFGSGKGRVMVVAAAYGFKKTDGIDFAALLCKEAEKNIEKIKPLFPSSIFRIICKDVVDYKIQKDTNVFFFFNPFDEVVMLQVVKNILASLKENSRKIYVVYINPVQKEIFLSAGFHEEYFVRKMEFLEFSILSKQDEEENDSE